VILLIGLGLSAVLLYLGFAPQAPRWRFSLGLLGAGFAGAVWWRAGTLGPLTKAELSNILLSIDPYNGVGIPSWADPRIWLSIPLLLATALIAVALFKSLQGRRRFAALGLGILLPLTIGLFVFNAPSNQLRTYVEQRKDTRQNTLDQNRALWQANHPARYRFTIQTILFCVPGHCPADETVTVTEGNAPSWTVETLFGRIQKAIDRGYYTVEVTYHPQLGYPTDIRTDPNPLMTDQSIHLIITDFQILP